MTPLYHSICGRRWPVARIGQRWGRRSRTLPSLVCQREAAEASPELEARCSGVVEDLGLVLVGLCHDQVQAGLGQVVKEPSPVIDRHGRETVPEEETTDVPPGEGGFGVALGCGVMA